MIIVVSDASPIIALHKLSLLSLLERLYNQVLVPPAVQRELQSPPNPFQQIELSGIEFIEVRAPQDKAQVRRFLRSLDQGESEALALALEVHAGAVLIDESAGRKVASQYGIRPLGTLGILLDAKEQGHIPAIRPLMDKLVNELDFFISDKLLRLD